MVRVTRTQLREHFDLGRKRWATIARQFSSLVPTTSGSNDVLIGVLTDMYKLRDDPRALAEYRRRLQRSARAARATTRLYAGNLPVIKKIQHAARRSDYRRRDIEEFGNYTVSSRILAQGDILRQFSWDQSVCICNLPLVRWMADVQMKRLFHLMRHGRVSRDNYVSFFWDQLKTEEEREEGKSDYERLSTKFMSLENSDEETIRTVIIYTLLKWMEGYEKVDFLCAKAGIISRECATNGAGARKRRDKANAIWMIPGEYQTQTNCFYIAIEMLKRKNEFLDLYAKWIADPGAHKYPSFAAQACSKKKEYKRSVQKNPNLEMKQSFVNSDMITDLINHSNPRRSLNIYDSNFRLIEEYHPNCSARTLKKAAMLSPLEVQRSAGHYRPMIRWDDMTPEQAEMIKGAITKAHATPKSDEEAEAKPISKMFCGKAASNQRFVAWDIEATTDETGAFRPYAVGLSWYADCFDARDAQKSAVSYQDGGRMQWHADFWGLDCLNQFLSFVDTHSEAFDGAYFYAHNGGKFDLPLLLQALVEDESRYRVVSDRATMSNGRWLNLTLQFTANEKVIHFRDSIALIPGSLAKLCKDYSTPHQKLVETVSHEDINLDNWEVHKDDIRKYLAHDCLGLLELLSRYDTEIFDLSYAKKTEKNTNEKECANIIEGLLDLPHCSLVKSKPPWLRMEKGKYPLELDGLSEEHGIAFEFNGEQHYKHIEYFMTKEQFEKQRMSDAFKITRCVEKGINLVVVPFNVDRESRVDFIRRALQATVNETVSQEQIRRERVLAEGGVGVTDCVTAASLSKKIFYNKYYKPEQNKIYNLTPTEDNDIRTYGFFGGRVELFKMGVVSGPVYYMDFTSLYPAMGLNDLPCGKPEFIDMEKPSEDALVDFGAHAHRTRRDVCLNEPGYMKWVMQQSATSTSSSSVKALQIVYRKLHGIENEEDNLVLPPEFFGFVDCWVCSTEEGYRHVPLHGVKSANLENNPEGKAMTGGKLVFPHLGRWTRLTLFSEEMRLGHQRGLYHYRIIRAYRFKRAPVLRDLFKDLFVAKSQAKAEGKAAKVAALKVCINSSFGWWGLRTRDRETVSIHESGDVPVYNLLAENKLIDEVDHGRYTVLRYTSDLPVNDNNVSVAAGITSYGRMRLWQLMEAIKEKGGEVYSCDTDSITTNLNVGDYQDLLDEFIPDHASSSPGAELGSLKCECTDEIEGKLKKRGVKGKELEDAMRIERGSDHWRPIPFYHERGSLVNSANKLYSLQTRLKSDPSVEISLCKAKGFTKNDMFKLCFDDYRSMHGEFGQPMVQENQPQFKMGLQGYCTDGGIKPVTMRYIKKTAHAQYSKGEIDEDTGVITPLVI